MLCLLLLIFSLFPLQVNDNIDDAEHTSYRTPHIERIVHRNVPILPDTIGSRRFFLDDFVTSAKDVLVYMDGVRLPTGSISTAI